MELTDEEPEVVRKASRKIDFGKITENISVSSRRAPCGRVD